MFHRFFALAIVALVSSRASAQMYQPSGFNPYPAYSSPFVGMCMPSRGQLLTPSYPIPSANPYVFVSNPYSVPNPNVVNPYVASPYAPNPFVANPYVPSPYVANPYAANPYVLNPYASNPYSSTYSPNPYAVTASPYTANPFAMSPSWTPYSVSPYSLNVISPFQVGGFNNNVMTPPPPSNGSAVLDLTGVDLDIVRR